MSAKVIAGHVAGTCPDIFMINMANLGEAIASGCMEPLENLFYQNWTEEQKADIGSELFAAGTDGTYHYEVPLFSGCFGIMYRIDLFEEFGIKVEDIKTWDDLAQVAQKLTYVNDEGLQVYGYGVGYSTEVTDPHGVLPTVLFSQPGSIFTEAGEPNNWEGEQGQKGLQYQIDLIDKYNVMPASAIALTSEEIYNMFEAGQFAMISGGSIRVPTVKSLTAFDPDNVGFMAYPQWNEGQPHSIANAYAWNTAVWSGSAHKAEAGKFLEYIVSPEADELWVREAAQIPILSSTYAKCADVIDTAANSWMKTAQYIYNNSALVFAGAYSITGFALDLQNAMIYAYSDGYTVPEALQQASQDFIDRNVGR
ncbi:MAG: extracellular solute-binding protein [Clostridia bacterium]|nr:extracellular solute-binding protein [Clostridia bacterium]